MANKEAEGTGTIAGLEGEREGRTCACVHPRAIECTMWRYNEDRETVLANQDWCECFCHEYEGDEDYD